MWRRTSSSSNTMMIQAPISGPVRLSCLRNLANHIHSTYSGKNPLFQRENYHSLLRKIQILARLFECVGESSTDEFSDTAVTCFTEFYHILNETKDLLTCCLESSRLRLLLLNLILANYFRNLDLHISSVVDIIPFEVSNISEDTAHLVRVIKNLLPRRQFFADLGVEELKMKLFRIYYDLQVEILPTKETLQQYFVEKLLINDMKTFIMEIRSLEVMISNHDTKVSVPSAMLKTLAALMRYSGLLIFGLQEDAGQILAGTSANNISYMMRNEAGQVLETSVSTPEDFTCPISHELMLDPVILGTGHTFDRASITEWFRRGNLTCPITRAKVNSGTLIPNRAMQNQISMWCNARQIPYNPPNTLDEAEQRSKIEAESSRSILVVNMATVKLLLELFFQGSQCGTSFSVSEVQPLTDGGRKICTEIVNAGGIPFLVSLLRSEESKVQEDAMVLVMHLSQYKEYTVPYMEVRGCVKLIHEVFRSGKTEAARNYAIATLQGFSSLDESKKQLAREKDVLFKLLTLLTTDNVGVARLTALRTIQNIFTLEGNFLIEAGCVKVVVQALKIEELKMKATQILGEMVKTPQGAREIRRRPKAVPYLLDIYESGNPSQVEAATETLEEFIKFGGSKAMRENFRHSQFRRTIPPKLRSNNPEVRSEATSLLRELEGSHRVQADIRRQSLPMDQIPSSATDVLGAFMREPSDEVLPFEPFVPMRPDDNDIHLMEALAWDEDSSIMPFVVLALEAQRRP